MNRLLLILIACVTTFSGVAVETPSRPQHNFLFIVDSSVSMEQRKSSAIKLVRDVIGSRFDSQIEAGDSIDIWTYDTENNLHGFPPQIWQPENARHISDAATEYLQNYQFKGKSEFANVAADLNILVPQTKCLLIVIITDGEQPFSGINLDLEINGYLAKKGKLNPAGTDPLLISLAAINGGIRTWTAYFGQGELGLASLPGRKPAARSVAETTPQKPTPQRTTKTPALHDATAPESFSTFNYPPGTRITPTQPMPPVSETKRSEKPLALLASNEMARIQKSLLTKAAEPNTAPAANKPASPVPLPTNAIPPQTKVAQAPATNSALALVASTVSEKKTNVLAAASNKPSENLTAKKESKTNHLAIVPSITAGVSGSANLPTHGTLRGALYISGLTGLSCVLVGSYLLYRKFRRPTQSIISRSLLQR